MSFFINFLIILLLFLSCAKSNLSVHEENLYFGNKKMLKQDKIMKNKMINARKQSIKVGYHKTRSKRVRKFVN